MTEALAGVKRYVVPGLVLLVAAVLASMWYFWASPGPGHAPTDVDSGLAATREPSSPTTVALGLNGRDVAANRSGPPSAALDHSAARQPPKAAAAHTRQISLRQTRDPVSYGELAGMALSPAEARWMARQGLYGPASPDAAYLSKSVDQLAKIAKQGDVRAAFVAGKKAFTEAFQNAEEAQSSVDDSSGVPESMAANGAPTNLASHAERERMRSLWWLGVVHGSSVAAGRMAMSYMTISGNCLQPLACNAWTLVAWRMGNWRASTLPLPPGTRSPSSPIALRRALHKANAIWARINAARARIGLSPLQLDLRPDYRKWQRMKADPATPTTVYLP